MGFSPPVTQKIFFQKSYSVNLVPFFSPDFMHKCKTTDEQSLRYISTEGLTDTNMDRTRAITRDPVLVIMNVLIRIKVIQIVN